MAKLKRPSMLMFLGVPTGTAETPATTFCLAGVYSDDLSIAYNPTTETSQDVTEVAGTTDVTAYSLNIPVTTKVVAASGQKGYVLSHHIQELRRSLATAGDAEMDVLIVDTYETSAVQGSYVAQKFSGTVQIDTYGGSATETLGVEYTVNINGEPVNGTVTITTAEIGDKTAVFTADTE